MKPAVFTGGRAGPLTLVDPPAAASALQASTAVTFLGAGFAGVGFGAGVAGAGVVGVGVVGVGVVGVGRRRGRRAGRPRDRVGVQRQAPAPFACAPASSRPAIVTLFWTEMSVCARTVPTKVEPVFSVVELPTCQKTLQA